MTYKLLLAEIKERLAEAFADGDHQAARAIFLEMLQVGKAWLLELREWPTHSEADQAQRFTEALEALEETLRRNDELTTFAPFLIGERVEIERTEYGPRFVWVEATIIDCRPTENWIRMRQDARALDYLVKDRDGEEIWRADRGLRKTQR